VDDPRAIEIAEENYGGGCAMADDGEESEVSILDELAEGWFEGGEIDLGRVRIGLRLAVAGFSGGDAGDRR